MKKCLNNRANHENLDLLHIFKNLTNQTKKINVLKIISYFASAPYIYTVYQPGVQHSGKGINSCHSHNAKALRMN